MKNILQVSRLHLEILYQLKTNSFINEIKLNGFKFRLNGELSSKNHKYNLIRLLKKNSPLFFNEFSDSQIKSSIIDIIKDTYKNTHKNTKIYKLSMKKIDKFITTNKIRI